MCLLMFAAAGRILAAGEGKGIASLPELLVLALLEEPLMVRIFVTRGRRRGGDGGGDMRNAPGSSTAGFLSERDFPERAPGRMGCMHAALLCNTGGTGGHGRGRVRTPGSDMRCFRLENVAEGLWGPRICMLSLVSSVKLLQLACDTRVLWLAMAPGAGAPEPWRGRVLEGTM